MVDNDDEFFVEDESLDKVRAAMRRGERGDTVGPRRLSVSDQAIVDLAASRVEPGGQVIQLLFGSSGEVTEIEVSNTKSRTVDITIPFEAVAG